MLHPICEECQKNVSEQTHHIISPFQPNLSESERMALLLDPNNLKALCASCHNAIHQMQQNKIKKKEYNEKQSTIGKINENKEQNEIQKIALLKKVEELSTKKELDESSKEKSLIEKKQFVKGETKNCFWIPEQTPSNKTDQLKKPLE